MAQISPLGPAYQAGTLSGNPLAMTAGIETLRLLGQPGVYERLEESGARLEKGLADAAKESGRKVTISRLGSALTTFFNDGPVSDYVSAAASDREQFAAYFHRMLDRGIALPPSPVRVDVPLPGTHRRGYRSHHRRRQAGAGTLALAH